MRKNKVKIQELNEQIALMMIRTRYFKIVKGAYCVKRRYIGLSFLKFEKYFKMKFSDLFERIITWEDLLNYMKSARDNNDFYTVEYLSLKLNRELVEKPNKMEIYW